MLFIVYNTVFLSEIQPHFSRTSLVLIASLCIRERYGCRCPEASSPRAPVSLTRIPLLPHGQSLSLGHLDEELNQKVALPSALLRAENDIHPA